MMNFTKLTSVTLKEGHGDPYTIPCRFSMRGTYTPNLVILVIMVHHLYDEIRKVDLCDLESGSK